MWIKYMGGKHYKNLCKYERLKVNKWWKNEIKMKNKISKNEELNKIKRKSEKNKQMGELGVEHLTLGSWFNLFSTRPSAVGWQRVCFI